MPKRTKGLLTVQVEYDDTLDVDMEGLATALETMLKTAALDYADSLETEYGNAVFGPVTIPKQ